MWEFTMSTGRKILVHNEENLIYAKQTALTMSKGCVASYTWITHKELEHRKTESENRDRY